MLRKPSNSPSCFRKDSAALTIRFRRPGGRRKPPQRRLSLLRDPRECRLRSARPTDRRDRLRDEAGSLAYARHMTALAKPGVRGAPKDGRRHLFSNA
jgi:hypothetical protein